MTLFRRAFLVGLTGTALTTTARAQPAETPERVEILLDWRAPPTYAGFYIAGQLGSFERRGLDVKFTETQGAISAAEKIGAGSPFWIGSSSGIATAIGCSRGLPIRSVAVYYHRTPTVI